MFYLKLFLCNNHNYIFNNTDILWKWPLGYKPPKAYISNSNNNNTNGNISSDNNSNYNHRNDNNHNHFTQLQQLLINTVEKEICDAVDADYFALSKKTYWELNKRTVVRYLAGRWMCMRVSSE